MSDAHEPVLIRADALRETEDGWVLVGSRCVSGHVSFPPRATCPECLGEMVAKVDLAQAGTVFAHTVVHMRTAHFNPPYQVGYVDLDHDGPRVFAPLSGDGMAIGRRVRLSVGPMWEENEAPVIAYQFVATEESEHA